MSYAIMRCAKLKGMGSVAASLQHCFRERETLNADPERTPNNEHLAASSTDSAMGKLRELLPEKRRKDAVLAIEYVMTASPDWWERATESQQKEFVTESKNWLEAKYGAENVIAMSVHRDELTPHLSAFVVPKTKDGRLSAKEFIGNKTLMSKDQTSFASAVKHLGLKRGLEGSRATHQRVKSHYKAINEVERPSTPVLSLEDLQPQKIPSEYLSTTKKLLGAIGAPTIEAPEAHLRRLNQKIEAQTQKNRELAAELLAERQRRKNLEDQAQSLKSQIKNLGLDQVPWGEREAAKEFFSKFIEQIETKRNKTKTKTKSFGFDR